MLTVLSEVSWPGARPGFCRFTERDWRSIAFGYSGVVAQWPAVLASLGARVIAAGHSAMISAFPAGSDGRFHIVESFNGEIDLECRRHATAWTVLQVPPVSV